MSLVAYAASSDEDSENEDNSPQIAPPAQLNATKSVLTTSTTEGHISDEDDYVPEAEAEEVPINLNPKIGFLDLPKPKNVFTVDKSSNLKLDETIAPVFAKLPTPKGVGEIKEEDDEFLHKKATMLSNIEIEKPTKPAIVPIRAKITIPSMKDFRDVDEDLAKLGKKQLPQVNTKRSGLLSMLPQAKSEQNFAKHETTATANAPKPPVHKSNSFVPDTVRNRRPAHNTEGVDGIKISARSKKSSDTKKSLVQCSDSEGSDDEPGDFFSLKDDEKLPEVNANEINVMVAKRAAKMAETQTKYLENTTTNKVDSVEQVQYNEESLAQAQKRNYEAQLNEEALQALVGSSSKRRRRQQPDKIEIVDISSNQVLPDREEWMRSALASQTSYQPTGVLVDEEPVAGTRRKHQITYLAHKAKANEAELQAMWSTNRQNRRATQSKYGF